MPLQKRAFLYIPVESELIFCFFHSNLDILTLNLRKEFKIRSGCKLTKKCHQLNYRILLSKEYSSPSSVVLNDFSLLSFCFPPSSLSHFSSSESTYFGGLLGFIGTCILFFNFFFLSLH